MCICAPCEGSFLCLLLMSSYLNRTDSVTKVLKTKIVCLFIPFSCLKSQTSTCTYIPKADNQPYCNVFIIIFLKSVLFNNNKISLHWFKSDIEDVSWIK